MRITSETVVLVTGASSGIGRELALELARRGASVALLARRGGLLDEVAAEITALGGQALALRCDVTVREEFERAVGETIRRFGRLDVLVNNAGRGNYSYIIDTPDQQIESIFRVNVFSLWYGTSAALRHMLPRRTGLVVNISSLAGKLGYPANGAYVAAKHAVVGFTRALRAELAGTGVQAMVITPGGTLTDWASVTEGGPILALFGYEAERGAELAAERGTKPPPQMPLLSAGEVAVKIADAIADPAPEVCTHEGSQEFIRQYESDQSAVEGMLEPYWEANHEGYEAMKRQDGLR